MKLVFTILSVCFCIATTSAQAPFITTWKTDNPGDSDDQSIRIPMIGNGYDFTVDWGDGNDEDYNTNPGVDVEHFLEHTYATAGEYEVKIIGNFPRIYINSEGDEDKILTINQWGDIAWTSMHDAFRGASNLTYNATDTPDLSGVTDLSGAFRGTDLFNGDIGNWDVSTVTNMSSMFAFTDAFNQDIGFNQGTGEGWDVSNVINMNNMFQAAKVFDQDIGGWDVSSVTSMADMFSEADAFNQDIADWDVSKVETMEGMFFGTDVFNQNIGYDPHTEEGWDVSSVTDMSGMFAFAGAFNQDISGWDVSSVTLMLATFFDAGSFNQDLGGWNISSVATMESMLSNSGLSTENYDATLIGWAAQTVESDVDLGADGLTYCDGADARGVLTGAPNNWTITGDELAEDCGEFRPFITTWKTDNPGDSDDQSIRIPMIGNGYDFTVDWGDGNDEDYNTNPGVDVEHFLEHTYASTGEYEVKITGDFPRIYFNFDGDRQKIQTIDQWGDIEWESMERAFRGASELTYNATDSPDLTSVTSMASMFDGASTFNGAIGDWTVSSVTDMSALFFNAAVFNQDISGWDVSEVTNMIFMFASAGKFNQDIGAWDVGKVTNMGAMFQLADSFNQDISRWDVSSVTDMSFMFSSTDAFNQDIGYDPDTEEGWDVSGVTNMSGMFNAAEAFDQDIGNWDVSSVTNMLVMFEKAKSFNQDIGGWNVGSVTDMDFMFSNADAFNQNLGDWDISSVTTMESILDNSGLSTENYDKTLIGWAALAEESGVQSGVKLGANGLTYCEGESARQSLISDDSWEITGDTLSETCGEFRPFITTWKTDNGGTSCSSCITIPTHPGSTYNYEVDWDNDGVYEESGITGDVTHDFGTPGTYTIAIRGDFPRIYFNNRGDTTKLSSVDQWGDIEWESMESAFRGCRNLNGPIADVPDLSRVTNMNRMFAEAGTFNQDIGDWDVSNVMDMTAMFLNAFSFNQNIGDWDVSNVTDMTAMFWGALSFNQDVGNWDVSNVMNMRIMFIGADNFNQDIGDWDVSNVTNMGGMFYDAHMFNQDISAWNVSNVTNMGGMFLQNTNFNQDIGSWDVSNVVDMMDMFSGASSFNQDIGDWDVSNVTNMSGMLNNSGLSCENYSATLIGWAHNPQITENIELGAEGMMYGNYAEPARDSLLNKGWTITGDEEGSCTTSTDRPSSSEITLYPNPAAEQIWIDIKEPREYRILDTQGRHLRQGITHGTLDVSALSPAMYFVHLMDDEGRTVFVGTVVKK